MQNNFEVIVNRRIQGAEKIAILELVAADGKSLPSWSAGAHIDIQTQDNTGRIVQRQYSLCGSRDESSWQVAVFDADDGRGGSRWLQHEATVGTQLLVSAPRNNFRLHADASPAILVAGGIGITPILAMARELKARGSHFSMNYFARSKANAVFHEEIYAGDLSSNSKVSFDTDPVEKKRAISDVFSEMLPETHLYVCGPHGFMELVMEHARTNGLPSSNIHRELFSSTISTASDIVNNSFEIQLRSTGQVILVNEGTTAVQALAQAGIDVVVSCEQGFCGSCLTRVVDGIPDHRDQFMMPEEQERNDCFTPCCSRALTSRLVLDL